MENETRTRTSLKILGSSGKVSFYFILDILLLGLKRDARKSSYSRQSKMKEENIFENIHISLPNAHKTSADPEGGGGTGGPDPPEKSHVIWVSIGNKQLDPPGKKWTPPPWKMLDPLWNLGK